MSCDPVRRLLPAYVDNELSVESALEVERHLQGCFPCHVALERQQRFVHTVGQLYPRAPLPQGFEERLRRTLQSGPRHRFWLNGLALAASVLLAFGAVRTLVRAGAPAIPASVVAAADMYHRAADQAVPLAIRSADPAAVNAWLTRNLSFPISDPVRQPAAMALEGASVVDLAGERAGYVQYRWDTHLVSLFVLPPRTWPDAGHGVRADSIEFHLFTVAGLKLIAWNHQPVSYVLVSDLAGQGGQACAVCHAGMADRSAVGALDAGKI